MGMHAHGLLSLPLLSAYLFIFLHSHVVLVLFFLPLDFQKEKSMHSSTPSGQKRKAFVPSRPTAFLFRLYWIWIWIWLDLIACMLTRISINGAELGGFFSHQN
ncbi:hypothetical protein DL95DRAFT_115098 [Leptodontidium sp. 2 PMI_412]|nr:hypothetical protein DL95DRAFT_115098 [Leptodontidium sp. 2 PMI_412]